MRFKVIGEVYARLYGNDCYYLLPMGTELLFCEGNFYVGEACYWISSEQQKGLQQI